MRRAKRAAALAVAAACALTMGVSGCSDEGAGGSAPAEQQEAAYELTDEEALKSLEVGQTAVFEPYEVTVEKVDIADSGVTAHVRVKAHDQDQSLRAKYLGSGIAETSFEDGKIEVPAGEEVSGTITYSSATLTSLEWENWGFEATWSFPNDLKDAEDAAKVTSSGLEAIYAWQAVEDYGKNEYPYGFKLHYIAGKLAEENEGDTWFLKATCDVENAAGNKMKGMNCEAQVGGTNESPQVAYFNVY